MRLDPLAGWWACVVVLSIPAYNEYRADVLREPGYWLFLAVALNTSLAIITTKKKRNLQVVASVLAVGLAALFRLESLFLLPALLLAYTRRAYLRRGRISIAAVYIFGFSCVAAIFIVASMETEQGRVRNFVQLVSPDTLWTSFMRDTAMRCPLSSISLPPKEAWTPLEF